MDLNKFIKDFSDQFDRTDISEFTPETKFRDLEEWSSLTGFAILNMIRSKYKFPITAEQMLKINTINDFYDLVKNH